MAGVPHLLDSNTFLRLAKRDAPEHVLIKKAIDHLIEEGADVCYTPQNVVEFWNVFTRPREKNGFGMTVLEADRETSLIESLFTFLPDNERIHVSGDDWWSPMPSPGCRFMMPAWSRQCASMASLICLP